jgi:xylulose-5-phosphate/fructose-6-phosphate phosphoketolase
MLAFKAAACENLYDDQTVGVMGGVNFGSSLTLSTMKPNPPPDRSQLPESVLDLRVKLNNIETSLTKDEREAVDDFRRVANYMSTAMIYLKGNTLMETPLKKEDIKPRLLGHFGTGPGLVLIYAHLK